MRKMIKFTYKDCIKRTPLASTTNKLFESFAITRNQTLTPSWSNWFWSVFCFLGDDMVLRVEVVKGWAAFGCGCDLWTQKILGRKKSSKQIFLSSTFIYQPEESQSWYAYYELVCILSIPRVVLESRVL